MAADPPLPAAVRRKAPSLSPPSPKLAGLFPCSVLTLHRLFLPLCCPAAPQGTNPLKQQKKHWDIFSSWIDFPLLSHREAAGRGCEECWPKGSCGRRKGENGNSVSACYNTVQYMLWSHTWSFRENTAATSIVFTKNNNKKTHTQNKKPHANSSTNWDKDQEFTVCHLCFTDAI